MSRQTAGARARNNGDAFESWLESFIFTPLNAEGTVARFDKQNPEMYAKNLPGQGVWFRPKANSGGDWLLLMAGGRYAVIESKSTTDDRFYEKDIPTHQQNHLRAAQTTGAGAYLALRFANERTPGYLIPWAAVPWEVARTARSLRPELLRAWAVGNWTDAKRILTTGGRP